MSSRAEILRSRILDCGNPTSNPSLNQRALKEIWEGEERFNSLKGKVWRVARRQARKIQAMQDSEGLPDTIKQEIF